MIETFDTDVFRQNLKTECIGKKIIYSDVTGSTMDDARKFGVNDPGQHPHGTIIMAERQTKARGARDHKWDSSNTGNIYISVILHLPQTYKTFEGRFDLEVAACMALFDVTRKLGLETIPKWPNDLWLRGHKLAGFLAEDGRFDIPGSNLCLVILGLGINVNADVRRNSGLYSIATSVLCERNGQQVCREEFLSDVCLALEETLVSRTNNLLKYRKYNLFQTGCHISVTCPSENRVIDGEFVEICDNWDISFSDKRTGEILHGRSDYFTIRPKVHRKILVVFAGLTASSSAATVASRLTSIVDTSKWVVCSVPESAVTQAEEWMKTCDLLVLAEDVCDSMRLTSKLTQYLKKGGNLLTSGLASYFTAKIFEIPFKEGILQSLGSDTNISVISVEYNNKVEGNGDLKASHNGNGSSPSTPSSHVIFPTSLIYFRFSQDYTMNETSSSSRADNSEKILSTSKDDVLVSDRHLRRAQSLAENDKNISFRYFPVVEGANKECCIAIMTKTTTYGGSIAVFGFDLGHNCLPPFDSTLLSPSCKNEKGDNNGKDCDVSGASTDLDKIVKDVDSDRFKRDSLIYQVLNVLNIT